jgi:hypothetical protein
VSSSALLVSTLEALLLHMLRRSPEWNSA